MLQCCEHAEEIAQLRGELADLRAQVERLTRSVTASSQHERSVIRAPSTGELSAEPRSQDELGAPVPALYPRRRLPYADRDSPDATTIALYRALFAGRQDVYAYRWENAATGEGGWAPRRAPRSPPQDRPLLPPR